MTTTSTLAESPLSIERASAALHAETARLQHLLATVAHELDDAQAGTREASETAFAVDDRRQLEALAEECHLELAEVAAALDRLERGTYGKCDRCDRPISSERLEVMPAGRHCVSCARRPQLGVRAFLGPRTEPPSRPMT